MKEKYTSLKQKLEIFLLFFSYKYIQIELSSNIVRL